MYLTDKGLLSTDKIEALEEEIKNEIQEAVDRAEQHMNEFTEPLVMFDHAYAELTPTLMEQREELSQELAADQKEATHG